MRPKLLGKKLATSEMRLTWMGCGGVACDAWDYQNYMANHRLEWSGARWHWMEWVRMKWTA
eukprot:11176050-Lingulodinium_polyedra.AAC.1